MTIDHDCACASTARLNIRVRITPEDAFLPAGPIEAQTIDLAPLGACVVTDTPIPIGTVVELSARRFFFATRAAVRSIYRDRHTGVCILGLEFVDYVTSPWVAGAYREYVGAPDHDDVLVGVEAD